MLEDYPVGLDTPDVPEPDDALDLPQRIELARTEHRAAVHRRGPRRVEAEEPPRRLEPLEQVVDIPRLGAGLGIGEIAAMIALGASLGHGLGAHTEAVRGREAPP